MEPWKAILFGAVGTWIIAIIAVGDRLIGFILSPKLRIQLNGFSGTTANHGNDHKARYYFGESKTGGGRLVVHAKRRSF